MWVLVTGLAERLSHRRGFSPSTPYLIRRTNNLSFRLNGIDALRADVAAALVWPTVVGHPWRVYSTAERSSDLWGSKDHFTHFFFHHELEVADKLRLKPREERKKHGEKSEATNALLLAGHRQASRDFLQPRTAFPEIQGSLRIWYNTQIHY